MNDAVVEVDVVPCERALLALPQPRVSCKLNRETIFFWRVTNDKPHLSWRDPAQPLALFSR